MRCDLLIGNQMLFKGVVVRIVKIDLLYGITGYLLEFFSHRSTWYAV